MSAFRNYLETFIQNPDLVDIILGLFVLLVAMAIVRALGFGLFKD